MSYRVIIPKPVQKQLDDLLMNRYRNIVAAIAVLDEESAEILAGIMQLTVDSEQWTEK